MNDDLFNYPEDNTLPIIVTFSKNALAYEDIVMFLKSLKNPTRAEKQDTQPNDPNEKENS